MDAILQLPPIPPHDDAPLAPVPHEIVATWPAGTFLENLVVLPDGDIVVSVLSEARLDRVTPAGAVSVFRQFEAPPTGLAVMDGRLYVAVGEPGAGEPHLWQLDPQTGDGQLLMKLDGMQFANGVTPFAPQVLLVADSWRGALMRVDVDSRSITPWFEHDALTRAPGVPMLPGANGVKRFGAEVAVSSNGRAELYRIAVGGDGRANGMTRIAERLRVDDMAYDRLGRLYLTTHIGHSLDRLDRDGARVALGGPAQGLAGPTACAFGGPHELYVTTTGGILLPPDGVLQPAKLVRLTVDATGLSLSAPWEVAP